MGIGRISRIGRVGRVGGGVIYVDPLSVAGLAAWYDASREVVPDLTAIASATDYSGNNRPALNAAGTKQPLLRTNIQGGKSIYRFDGVDDFLSAIFTLPQPTTVIVVAKQTAVNVARDQWSIDGGNDVSMAMVFQTNTVNWRQYAGTFQTIATADTTTFHRVALVFNGANSSRRFDDNATVTTNPGTGTPGGVTLGSRATGGDSAAIDIGEYMVYSRALSTGEIDLNMAYLKAKWGLV